MLQVGLADTLQAVLLNQFYDALKAGPDIDWKSVKCGLGFFIEKSCGPRHE
jgi:hypothetical protein